MKVVSLVCLLLMAPSVGCLASEVSADLDWNGLKSISGCHPVYVEPDAANGWVIDSRPISLAVLLAMVACSGAVTLAASPAKELRQQGGFGVPEFVGYDANYQKWPKTFCKGQSGQLMIYRSNRFRGKYSSATENRHTMAGYKLFAKNSVQQRKK